MKREITDPLFTIVTVCYNEEKKIRKAIESVLVQNCINYEYIIVDGGSTDNTLKIIKSYQSQFEGRLRFLSEKDDGLYDAMNKAVHMAKGKYVSFINADDKLQPYVLKEIEKEIIKEPTDILYGDSINVYVSEGNVCSKVKSANPDITLKSLGRGMGVVHQSIFAKVEIMQKIGCFNKKYRIGADWDFIIRCVKNDVSFRYVNIPICEFMTDGVSSKVHNKERHIIRKDNHLYRFIDWDMIKDYLDIRTMIQVLIGSQNYAKLRYLYNRKREWQNR